jgi:uncharacterized protein Yka (UPF0111/DUF47 family)
MSTDSTMTRLDMIRLLGDVLTELDVLRASFDPGNADRKSLDDKRDELDKLQRDMTRAVLNENTQSFNSLSSELSKISGELRGTIDQVEEVAKTLETLVKLVEVVQKIAELAAAA